MKHIKLFSLSSLVVALLLSVSAHAVPPTGLSGLVGTWVNTNPATSGIVKVVITATASGIAFKSYGACSPTPCVHTTVVAYPHSASVSSNTAVGFTAFRDSGFAYTRFSGMRVGANLRLDYFTTFDAGDTRKNYAKTETFAR